MPPETSPVPAQLLERLLIDSDFRVQFRKDPVAACRGFGLEELAQQMSGQGRAMQTLEIRESKSSLAGVLMAAAAEAVGVVELVRFASGDGPAGGEAVSAVRQALSSPRLQALSMSQMRAVGAQDLADAPVAGIAPDAPTPSADPGLQEDLAAAASCPDCGSPTIAMGGEVTVCSSCGLRQNGARTDRLSADEQEALREDVMAAAACGDCAQPLPTMPDGSAGACLFCGALSAGAAHVFEGQDLAPAAATPTGATPSAQNVSNPGVLPPPPEAPDPPTGRAPGEPPNRASEPGRPERTAAKPEAGDNLRTPDRTSPAGADAPVRAGTDAPLGDEPLVPLGQPAPVGATVRVASVPAPGTLGDPPLSLSEDPPGSDGGERVLAGVADAPPAPTAAPGAPVSPVDPSLWSNTNAGGVLHGSEFQGQDAQGAPDSSGVRHHAGYDLFAEPSAPVRAPVAGTVVEVRASRGSSGQVFGGTVKIRGADGTVWVFRHVEPGSVVEGQQIPAGQQVATVTPWTDGPAHTHIERWRTLEGGYNFDNMFDVLPELEAAKAGQAAPGLPPQGITPGQPPATGDPSAALVPGAPVTDPQVLYDNAVQALLSNPRIELPAGARADLQAGVVDARLVIMLAKLSERHTISISVIKTGHSQFVAGTQTPSNHFSGRGLDIARVDGEIVNPGSPAARVLAQELGELGPPLVPDEIGTPFDLGGPPFFTDGSHQDHIHVGFDNALPPGTPLPFPQSVQPAAVPGAATPATPAAPAAPADPSMGRQSGVFAAVAAADAQRQGAAAPRGMTVKFMQAVTAPDPITAPAPGTTPAPGTPPPDAAPQATPVAAQVGDVPPGGIIPSDQFDPGDITPHPGPTASREAVAQWMAVNAQRVGIPGELPVMAGITESGLRFGLTPEVSDADSGGYFQMRVSIWNIPPWENYMNEPEKQLHWFLSQALALKEKRISEGIPNFGQDPSGYGEWIADVERPAAQYRDRYQTHLEEARQLISTPPQSP